MMVFICVFTPCGELCFTVLEENIASHHLQCVWNGPGGCWVGMVTEDSSFFYPVTSPPTWTNSVNWR